MQAAAKTVVINMTIVCHGQDFMTIVYHGHGQFKPPTIFILTVPKWYFCCGSLLLLVLAVRIYTLVQLLCS